VSAITPYILPSTLLNSPTGIDWGTLPTPNASAALQLATQYQMCARATQAADAFCNQVLRSTVDLQTESGPHRRLTIDNDTGVARLETENWPVLAVVSAQVAPANMFPVTWTVLTSSQYDLEYSVPVNTGSAIPGGAAQGGNYIRFAPYILSWAYGRKGMRVQVQYLNGWPHAGITQSVSLNATTLNVDDVTGWTIASASNPIAASLEDGASTEVVNVIGATPGTLGSSGPGILALASGCNFAHAGLTTGVPACMVTTMPSTIQTAVTWLAISQSLIRGASFLTVPNLPGSEVASGSGEGLDMLAYEQLLPYKRVI
jgi:hypothetical protein